MITSTLMSITTNERASAMKDKDAHATPATPSSNVHRFAKAIPPRHDLDAEEALDAYEKARAISREALVLEVRLVNGDTVSWPYSSLRKIKYFGNGHLELRFDGDLVIAEGRNLHRLKDAINEHRQRFIEEGTDIERGLKDEDAVHIDRIEITEREEDS
jgi:hypothetical protein